MEQILQSTFPQLATSRMHVIRLRGPWHVEPLARVSCLRATGRFWISAEEVLRRDAGVNYAVADWSAILGGGFSWPACGYTPGIS